MSDCTTCWNPISTCACGQRQHIYPSGVIDPDNHYDGKGTKKDPLHGKEKLVSKIRAVNAQNKKNAKPKSNPYKDKMKNILSANEYKTFFPDL
jgi:hypothetical protein